MLQEIEETMRTRYMRKHTVRPAEGWLPPYHAQSRIKLGVKILSRFPRHNAFCALKQWRWMANTTFAENELSARVTDATPDFEHEVVKRGVISALSSLEDKATKAETAVEKESFAA